MRGAWTYPAVILSIYDGDTLHLAIDLGYHLTYTARIRLATINAPELATPAGVAARDFATVLTPPGTDVTFTSHTIDKYGRPLGAITLPDGTDLAAALLAAGHAVPYP